VRSDPSYWKRNPWQFEDPSYSVPGEPVPGREEQSAEHAQAIIEPTRGGRYEPQPVTESSLLSVLRNADATQQQPEP
jgi:hypothetical protein